MRRFVFIPIALLFTLMSGTVQAQERQWIKRHHTTTMDEVVYSEFTYIGTADDASPYIHRILYKDDLSVLLVIRQATQFVGADEDFISHEVTITDVSTGETMTLTHNIDDAMHLQVGGGSFDFTHSIPYSLEARAGAKSLVDVNATQSFRDALQRLAKVGAYYCYSLQGLGELLRDLLFDDVLGAKKPANYCAESTDRVKPFDPNTTPPNAFDQQFGSAYYQ
jgi:hypothetical protein